MVIQTAFTALLLFTVSAHAADDEEVRPVFGAHPGYLFNVGEEKTKRDVEMVMLDKPKEPKKKPVVIFDEKLTKEIQAQYQLRFGQTQAEQLINNPGRDSGYSYYTNPSATAQQYQVYQRQFGEYMMRKLVDYHFDKWARNDPNLRPVYEVKEKLSNLNVTVKKGYKVKWHYNLAGPSMDASLDNPYNVETKVQILMTGIISKPREVVYSLGYQFTPRVKVETLYREYQELIQVVIGRQMNKHINMTLTGSSGQLPTDYTIHQQLILVGFSYN